MPITRKEVLGIMQSGYFTFVDGHIYHNNDVIKLRYDLLETGNSLTESITENEFFDRYENIFPLRPGCRLSSSNL